MLDKLPRTENIRKVAIERIHASDPVVTISRINECGAPCCATPLSIFVAGFVRIRAFRWSSRFSVRREDTLKRELQPTKIPNGVACCGSALGAVWLRFGTPKRVHAGTLEGKSLIL